MCAALAPARPRRDAADRACPGDRAVCAGLAPRRRPHGLDDRDGISMAALPFRRNAAGSSAAAAPELAQHRLAETQSLVRGGTGTRTSETCKIPRFVKQVSFPSPESGYTGNIF